MAATAAKGGSRVSVATGRATAAANGGMRAREGWARAELAKLCLMEVAPEHVRQTEIAGEGSVEFVLCGLYVGRGQAASCTALQVRAGCFCWDND